MNHTSLSTFKNVVIRRICCLKLTSVSIEIEMQCSKKLAGELHKTDRNGIKCEKNVIILPCIRQIWSVHGSYMNFVIIRLIVDFNSSIASNAIS